MSTKRRILLLGGLVAAFILTGFSLLPGSYAIADSQTKAFLAGNAGLHLAAPKSTATRTATRLAAATPTLAKNAKVVICHNTGSRTNPYVRTEVSENAVASHRAHGDIVPAPTNGCSNIPPTPTQVPISGNGQGTFGSNSYSYDAPQVFEVRGLAGSQESLPAGPNTPPSKAELRVLPDMVSAVESMLVATAFLLSALLIPTVLWLRRRSVRKLG